MKRISIKTSAIFSNRPLWYVLFGCVLASIPFTTNISNSNVTLLGNVVYFAVASLGFQVLLGYSGQISLGHTAFIGVGAYLSGYFVQVLHLPYPLAFLASAIVPLLLGLILGLIALRLEGYYLAIATLGLAESIRIVFIEAVDFTKGFSGFSARYPVVLGYQFSKETTFILMVGVLVALMILVYNFINAATGRALAAMRSSEAAAQAMGISLFKYKLTAFAISTCFAGMAGSLYMHFFRYSDPTIWNSGVSLNLVVACIVGGIASIEGAVLGAAFVAAMPELLKMIPFFQRTNGAAFVLSGVVIILVLLFYPAGLANIVRDTRRIVAKFITLRGKSEQRGARQRHGAS
ncbi:MAG: branched-chain amino acid ABC transporter permease [Bacillota bacterium]